MDNICMPKFNKNQSGQALIFVVATMTVAMAVGVGVSLRNLSSISRTSRTDTASRAQAAAEGGAENMLSRPESELKAFADSSPANGIDEVIEFTPTTGDNVTAVAEITVDHYNIDSSVGYLPLEIEEGQVSEVKLDGNGVEVCWSSTATDTDTDLYFVAYNDDGDLEKQGVESSQHRGFPSGYDTNFESSKSGKDGFDDCYDVSVPSNATALRIRSINETSRVGVYSGSGLPNQGYEITSVGKLSNVEQGEEAEAVVRVIRSLPYMPGIFDFGVFSGSTGDALD